MHCTQCGAAARGRFCGSCGASLRSLRCGGCGSEVPAGTRFCTACGTPVGRGAPAEGKAAGSSGGWSETAGWWVSGGLGGVLLAVIGFAAFGGDSGDEGPSAQSPAPAGPAAVDLSSMTPREAADRLFERVMTALEAGDTAEATNFLPMALQAYDMVDSLDQDGLYHVSTLQRAADDPEAALATALEGLEDNPDHLLNLWSAGEAARDLGDESAARSYYERLLAAWEAEMAAARPEYADHAPLLPTIREEARSFLEQGPS